MKSQKTAVKKLVSAVLLGTFAVTPFILSSPAAQADPPHHAPAWGHRDRHDRDWGRHNRRNDYRTFTGRVDRVESGSKFELRADGRTYDVYTNGRVRHLNRGDVVRVSGYRYGNNDIRNASVTVLRNR
jgi:Ni/Co efflux regulator RcnB